MEDVGPVVVGLALAGGLVWYSIGQLRRIRRGSDVLVADRIAAAGGILLALPFAATTLILVTESGSLLNELVAGVFLLCMLVGVVTIWIVAPVLRNRASRATAAAMNETWRWPSSLTLMLMLSVLTTGLVAIWFAWAETAFRICETTDVGCTPDIEGTFPWVTATVVAIGGGAVTLAVWGWQRMRANRA